MTGSGPAPTEHPTARRILDVALRLLSADGAGEVSMRRIGDELGLSAMALYRHFPNREALLERVTAEAFAALAARWAKRQARGDLMVRWRASADRYLDFAIAQPFLFDHLFSTPRPGARQFPDDFRHGESPTLNLVASLVEESMRCGLLRPDDVWAVTFTINAHSHGLVALFRAGRAGTSTAKFRRFYHDSLRRLFDGLTTR